MKARLKGLWRDTWWLWSLFTAIIVAIAVLDNIAFLTVLPILPGVFIYFALNRYDEDGHDIGDQKQA